MTLYIPIRQRLYHEALGHYSAYAIAALTLARGGGPACRLIPDISPELHFAALLALRCTLGGLDPAKLPDVVEDALP